MAKQRLDRWMVEHGVAETREKAQALIMAGQVLLNGQKALKPGQAVADDARVEVLAKLRYVSRGGLKLEGALQAFRIDVTGLVCADFGSSTGGFTDCLLQAGATKVFAIDVGTGQLDWKLRNDPRVVVREGVNARHLQPADLGESVDFAVCDVSFISATHIIPAMVGALKPDTGAMVVLVKPQFEVGKGQVGKGGIVRDPALHAQSCADVRGVIESYGFVTDMIESPITGAEGNREFLVYGRR
ncbi:MAG TPA: TlyA family RNA methyltransferase [Bryobacteraceae bacterium]|nr:TlyA family RNA methyltransferase [Bryobacteraceae bacterium]